MNEVKLWSDFDDNPEIWDEWDKMWLEGLKLEEKEKENV